MKPVGVVLAGCGFLDGAEIYESVLTLLNLDKLGIQYQCLAPDAPQMHVVNHATGAVTAESRNVLTEAARIARGEIAPLHNSWIEQLDAVIFPGGFGAAKNYCDYATKGDACQMNPIVESFMIAAIRAKLPVGAICIAPLVLARALKSSGISAKVTVGATSGASASVEKFGAKHQVCEVASCVVDHENLIVTTPAYMYDARISEADAGIAALVRELVALMKERTAATGKVRAL